MDRLIRQDLPKIDSMSAQMLLREAYETAYHIFDHENESQYHPWDLVLSRVKENYTDYDQLPMTIEKYRVQNVHGIFGLSLPEFLDLPREIVNLLLDICSREQTLRNEMQKAELANAENESKRK